MATPLYGFFNLENLFNKRVTEAGVDVVARAINASVAEHNRQVDALLSLFVRRTTEFKIRYKTPTAARLQALDEAGRARPIRPAGHYELGFPLQMAGAAWGADYVTRQKMTVQEANDATLTILSADARWVRDHILAALFVDGSWTFRDEEHGNLTVKGPASGDTDTYLIMAGADDVATDDHMLAQANAIDDSNNPFPTIHDELTEHPENGGEVVALIPTNLRSAVEGLATFHDFADPNIIPGNASDRLSGRLNVAVPGEMVGYVDKVWVAEWKQLPDNYIIGVPTDGEKPLAMREDEEAVLRGFHAVAEREDYPFWERQYMRRAGFGAWNRTGAVVYRIGNANYAVPANYGSPMP